MTTTPGRVLRLFLLCFVFALTTAPAALAVDECYPYCEDPEPDLSTPPVASIAGPDAKLRTDAITFDASASTGGTDTWGDSTRVTRSSGTSTAPPATRRTAAPR